MKFLVNPRRRRRGKRRKLYGAAAKAHAKKLARRKRRTHKRKYRLNPAKKGKRIMAKRKATKKRTTRRRRRRPAGLRTRVRRRFRRGARKMSRALVPMVTQGVKDAAGITVGIVATKVVSNLLPLPKTGAMGYGTQAVAAIAAGYAANRFLGANVGRMVLAGGLSVPLIAIVRSLNVPVVSSALGEYYAAALPSGLTAYPQQIASYPQMVGYGEMGDMGDGLGESLMF